MKKIVATNQSTSNPMSSALGLRNFRMMRLLAKIAKKFNEAGVPLMVLKGAALQMTLYEQSDERNMADLDLMVRPEDVDKAFSLLEHMDGLKGEPLVRDDFFPRFHYETEYSVGKIYPVKIDLHVRPFRPLRYAQIIPYNAFWNRSVEISIGDAKILVPSIEEMIIHLAVHAAVHAYADQKWLIDIKRWVDTHADEINWDRFLTTVDHWRLALPTLQALQRIESEWSQTIHPDVLQKLSKMRVNWTDRLALWQAPRDADHPATHVVVNFISTPGWWFTCTYLMAVLIPDKSHMADWYHRRHWGWLPCAHLFRCLGPITRRFPKFFAWFTSIETRRSPTHGIGVFSTRDFEVGEVVARYHGKPVDRCGMYVALHKNTSGKKQKIELTGKLRFLNHKCRPNAELSGHELIALKPIRIGQEIKIDYGEAACNCDREHPLETYISGSNTQDVQKTNRMRKRLSRRVRKLSRRKKVRTNSDGIKESFSRRNFLGDMAKKATYIAPIVMTLTAQPAFASSGLPSCVYENEACTVDSDCCDAVATCGGMKCNCPTMCNVDADCCSNSCGVDMAGKCD